MAGISPASVSRIKTSMNAEAARSLTLEQQTPVAMNKRSQIALAFAAGYLLLKMGIAIYRHPVGAVVVFAILTVFSVIGGASASDVVHATFSFAVIVGLVFIIGLACKGRRVAALLWFIALLICLAVLQGLIDYAATLAASGYLTDYHWWFDHRRGWVPSPAVIALNLLAVAVAIIKDIFFPPRLDDQEREPASGPDQRSTEEQKSAAPKAKREAVGSFVPNADPPVCADELGKRVGELEGEVRALRASVSRLQNAGKTVIAQREEWKARALVAEQKVTDLTAQLASRRDTRDDRFDALRRLVARELHPDHCAGGGLEKTIRAEFFKKLWPEIERLVERAE